MIRVNFTVNLAVHLPCPPVEVPGAGTVREVLMAALADNRRLLSYILDDQGALRHHMLISIGSKPIHDRKRLSDPVPDGAEVYVLQALSGG